MSNFSRLHDGLHDVVASSVGPGRDADSRYFRQEPPESGRPKTGANGGMADAAAARR